MQQPNDARKTRKASQPKSLELDLEWIEEGEARPESAPRVEALLAETEKVALAREGEHRDAEVRETGGLMEAIVEAQNMRRALAKVQANRGAAGIDGMQVSQLPEYLRGAWPDLRAKLLAGQYRPQAVRRVEIPKPDGGKRELGIPTVVDRLIQQAILQVLEPLLDPAFSPHSYGFRPGKSAHQALEAARGYVAEGYVWVVDLDVEKFFDRVNHDMLMGRLARRVTDKRLLKLIRGYLEAGVLWNGVVQERDEGTPQGGPLSPLLSNLLLDDLDKELERRGLRFCRYADDCNIYVRSERAGQRVMEGVTRFLERKLRLRVNPNKSAVARPRERKFLGQRILGGKGAYLGIHPRSVQRAKERMRLITRRNRGVSLDQVLRELGRFSNGWVTYHRHTRCKGHLTSLDEWLRRRLRCYIWKQWKHPRTRGRELERRGVGRYLAYGTAYNGMGLWRAAGSPALTRALPNQWLREQGFRSLLERYLLLNPAGTAGCGPARPVV